MASSSRKRATKTKTKMITSAGQQKQDDHLNTMELSENLTLSCLRSTSRALFSAVETGNLQVLKALFESSPSSTSCDLASSALLHRAIAFNQVEIVRYLLIINNNGKHGDDGASVTETTATSGIGIIDDSSRTPLQEAAARGNFEIVQLLLLHRDVHRDGIIYAPSRAALDRGMTALHLAAFNGHISVVQYLIQHAANQGEIDKVISSRTNFGANVLHIAAMFSRYRIAYWLVQKTPIDLLAKQTSNGAMALHYFAAECNIGLVRFVVEKQQPVIDLASALTNSGLNVLHFVVTGSTCIENARETIVYLLGKEPRLIDMRNNSGETPIDLAERIRPDRETFTAELKKLRNKFPPQVSDNNDAYPSEPQNQET